MANLRRIQLAVLVGVIILTVCVGVLIANWSKPLWLRMLLDFPVLILFLTAIDLLRRMLSWKPDQKEEQK